MSSEQVKIFEPDKTLKAKVGNSINTLLSEEKVKAAEKVIENSADEILALVMVEVKKIEKIPAIIKDAVAKKSPLAKSTKDELIESAFAIKSNAGLCGHPLVSEVAKSLYVFVEVRPADSALDEQESEIIEWHIETIIELLKQKITSMEGEFPKELQEQLEIIKEKFVKFFMK